MSEDTIAAKRSRRSVPKKPISDDYVYFNDDDDDEIPVLDEPYNPPKRSRGPKKQKQTAPAAPAPAPVVQQHGLAHSTYPMNAMAGLQNLMSAHGGLPGMGTMPFNNIMAGMMGPGMMGAGATNPQMLAHLAQMQRAKAMEAPRPAGIPMQSNLPGTMPNVMAGLANLSNMPNLAGLQGMGTVPLSTVPQTVPQTIPQTVPQTVPAPAPAPVPTTVPQSVMPSLPATTLPATTLSPVTTTAPAPAVAEPATESGAGAAAEQGEQ